jgi:hypothetical protein
MKKFLLSLFIIVIISINYLSLLSQSKDEQNKTLEGTVPISKLLMNNANLGTEFWVSFHPAYSYDKTNYELHITALKSTDVTIEAMENGVKFTKHIDAMKMVKVTSETGDLTSNFDYFDSEVISNKGIHITSQEPVSVYILIAGPWIGEGYQAIPVSAFGYDYIHNSYYDFQYRPEHPNSIYPGGFVIVASEDKTDVNIALKGVGEGYAKTFKGKKIGENISVRLMKGQTYMVCGDGESNGQWDLSGTRITANNPIGVISYHKLTAMPSFIKFWWNYFSEMLLPVDAWGKEFASLQYTRSGSLGQMGDFFRIVAGEDNTNWTCKYYGISDNKLIGNLSATLKHNGDFSEFYHISGSGIPSIRGVSYWKSDKPAMMAQYAYSAQWDNDNNWQPLMFLIPPVEQYSNGAIMFTCPDGVPSELNLFAIGDEMDTELKLLKSIKLDGQDLWKINAGILQNKIAQTNIYWVKLTNVLEGVHYLESNTKMGGFVYRSKPRGYAWPIGMQANKVNAYDVKPPQLVKSGGCGNFTITATEKQVGNPNDDPRQIDQGISKIILPEEQSTNFALNLKNPDEFKPQKKLESVIFYLDVIDRKKLGYAKYAALDRRGNMIIDSVSYKPDEIKLSNDFYDFGKVRVGKCKEFILNIQNIGPGKISFLKKKCKTCNEFSLADTCGFDISPSESFELKVNYIPQHEGKSTNDFDTLIIETTCNKYVIPLKGQGILPHIKIADWDFGEVEINHKKCIDEQNGLGFRFDNDGTDTVNITGIDSIHAPFFVEYENPAFPFSVPPGGYLYFKSVCFYPLDSGNYTQEISFKCDADKSDKSGNLKGYGLKPKDTTDVPVIKKKSAWITVQPNPFTQLTTIKVSLPYGSNSLLKIFDLAGNELETIYSGYLAEGEYNYTWDGSKYPNGSYYYKFQAGFERKTGVLIIKR